jgi:LytR cell envelope-related transcriptional attenuator
VARTEGYRIGRLRRRRDRKVQRWQLVFLAVLAGAVAFAAVLGAVRLADWIIGGKEEPRKQGYLALITVDEGAKDGQPSAVLALRDASDGKLTLFTVPRSLLLESPGGEYVFAGDMLASGQLAGDLERLLQAKIDFTYKMTSDQLATLAAGGDVWASLEHPVSLEVGGAQRGYKGRVDVPNTMIGTLLGAEGKTGADESAMQDALLRGVLDAAALQPEADRRRLVGAAVSAARGGDKSYLREILTAAADGHATVERLPSSGRTALGQFAYHPDGARIMAEVTRRVPGFDAPVTVLVRNGSGELGIGQAVIDKLAALNVDLPPAANADSFGYARTQILAGADALQAAEKVRAILGRGVVLDGSDLGPTTVMVIVGKDLKAKDLQ